ncbi:jumonji domain-containing 5 [Pyrenochaeta sp. MPI-SDFR-AT-0127]|nr:jumonji domain-containing 5 [Pyrenochaeta sp. MPI-SDFR-AT-0127]
MQEDAPTLDEIIQLTRHELTTASKDDLIRECGRAALSLLRSNPELCLKLAYQKLHDVPYKEVKTCWRRLYTDASLWRVVQLVETQGGNGLDGEEIEDKRGQQDNGGGKQDWIDEVVRSLDMALILTGAPGRDEVIELWFTMLKGILYPHDSTADPSEHDASRRPAKRRKLSASCETLRIPSSFPTSLPAPPPVLQYPIPRANNPSFSDFQKRVSDIEMHTPFIITRTIEHWPALDERPWNSPGYLLEQTLGGRRLVPVEIGKSYTDDGWGQRIITFREFMDAYMLDADTGHEPSVTDVSSTNNPQSKTSDVNPINGSQGSSRTKTRQTGYLAQHDLFAQIPSLRADISIPDYCYCDPAPSPHLTHIKPTPKLEEPLLNAWFGPAGTISPLHTDPYHNILAQAVGYKYIRLYAPAETENLYPRGIDENGVNMSNTSQVDMDEAIEVWPEIAYQGENNTNEEDGKEVRSVEKEQRRKDYEGRFPSFRDANYIEGILGPGECLYLPVGWWHYVKSLTPSFSVSFWFN